MVSIQVPINEINWPLKKSWKLRWRSARNASGSRERGGPASDLELIWGSLGTLC